MGGEFAGNLHRALLVLTDGIDSASDYSFHDALEACQRADTMVYTAHYFDEKFYRAAVRTRNPVSIIARSPRTAPAVPS